MTNYRKEPYLFLNQLIGFSPKQIDLYQLAFLHKSMGVKNDNGQSINNERLEFLGDAIITAVVSDLVFHHFNKEEEGFLTNIRSKIVKRETLNSIAIHLGIPSLIKIPAGSQVHGNNVFGNALEALVGAIYLDQGFERCKQFVQQRIIDQMINMDTLAKKEVNFKSRLIEWGQSHHVTVDFELINVHQDEQSEMTFETKVLVNHHHCGVGTGRSKKESQQNASEIALLKLLEDEAFQTTILNEKAIESKEKDDSDTMSNTEDEAGMTSKTWVNAQIS
ncbi:MAG: ribonuclease III [Microbacter sp.]